MSVGIIVKSYAHHNKALPNWNTPKGVWVKSKDHYDRLCKEAGMISYDKAQEIASGSKRKDYKLSNQAKAIIEAARSAKDSKGNVKLGDRTVEAMVKIGAIGKKVPSYMQLPRAYQSVGGFK